MKSDNTTNQSINIWKYLFLGLVILIALVFLFLISMSGDSEDIDTDYYVRSQNDLEIQFEVGQEDVETISNVFLEQEVENSAISYHLILEDNPELIGESSYLGIPFDFSVEVTPEALDNGNVRLDIDSISLSGIQLPEQLVLTILSNQMDLPEFVVFNPEDSYIGVNLNEFYLENGGQLTVDVFDLDNNNVRATIHLPVSAFEDIE